MRQMVCSGFSMSEITFTVPMPPSVNHYWRMVSIPKFGPRMLISSNGRDYRKTIEGLCMADEIPRNAVSGKLAIRAVVYPPDRRARDLDNLWKGLLDSLKTSQVIRDDADIDDLHIVRGEIRKNRGEMHIVISEISSAVVSTDDLFAGEACS
jgi:crossover junction endodeoxyribonuclease RusA